MFFIAHRGNLEGPNPGCENEPGYVASALQRGFDVEIDVHWHRGHFTLGHDDPVYNVDRRFLAQPGLWCHAKNLEALQRLSQDSDIHCFWHQEDDVALTSRGFLWTYPGIALVEGAIAVLPETVLPAAALQHCGGVCSDEIARYRRELA